MTEEEALAFLRERKGSYQQSLSSERSGLMMDDLLRFCRGDRSCFHPDARQHAVLEGRREVWLRIQEHLNWTPEMMLKVYGNLKKKEGDDDE